MIEELRRLINDVEMTELKTLIKEQNKLLEDIWTTVEKVYETRWDCLPRRLVTAFC